MLSNPTADFKSIELRLLAHLSEDPVLIDILNSQQSCDVFTLLASRSQRTVNHIYICTVHFLLRHLDRG